MAKEGGVKFISRLVNSFDKEEDYEINENNETYEEVLAFRMFRYFRLFRNPSSS